MLGVSKGKPLRYPLETPYISQGLNKVEEGEITLWYNKDSAVIPDFTQDYNDSLVHKASGSPFCQRKL